MKYRADNDLDDILKTYSSERIKIIEPYYPRGYCGICKLGRPIYIERMGMADADKALSLVTEEELMRDYYYEFELLQKNHYLACSYVKKHQVQQIFNIVDLTNFSVTMLVSKVKQLC